jgi:hypothetical protein
MAVKKKIEDAGMKIGGARKDWRDNHMTIADLVDMTGEERASLIKKDNVWPKPDFAALIEQGMPVEVAACIKVIRDNLAASPSKSGAKTNEESQQGYIEMVSAIRDVMLSVRSMEALKQTYEKLEAKFGGRAKISAHPTSAIWFSVYSKRRCPFVVDSTVMTKARELVSNGFPGVIQAWKRNVSFYRLRGNDGLTCYRGNQLIGTFATQEEGYAAVKEQYEAEEAAKKARKQRSATTGPKMPPARPHLDEIIREGMTDHRRGRDIDPEEFIETFGFRGVEFGNWVPDDERQRMLNLGYDGMMDLAEILGWEPQDMSLGGELAAAFGARGKGGKGAAHYEAGRKVYNFTRFNGAGSQAHEFAHALDHFLGQGTKVMGPERVPSATGWRHRLIYPTAHLLSHRGPEIAQAWGDVIYALENTRNTQEDVADFVRQSIQRYSESIDENKARARENAARGESSDIFDAAVIRIREKIAEQEHRLNTVLAKSPNDDFGTRRSSFFKEALKMSGPSGYEARPNEMFARAFECFVADEVEARGGISQYLVSGVDENLYADPEMWKGNPYPVGTERENFRALFGRAVEVTYPLVSSLRDQVSTLKR